MTEAGESRPSGLFSAFAGLLSSQLLNSASGFLFWLAAAALVPVAQVGTAVAVIGAVTLLQLLAMVGIDTLLLVELPHLGARAARRLIRVGMAVVSVVSVLLAAATCAVVLLAMSDHSALRQALDAPVDMLLMVAILVATSVGGICDKAAIGLNRTASQVTRNSIASLGRFPVLIVLGWVGGRSAGDILLAWLVPVVVSLLVFARRLRLGMRTPRVDRTSLRALVGRLWRTALGHFAVSLAVAAGPLLVPVVAAASLSPSRNAYFAIAWMVATVVFLAPYMLVVALFASSASGGARRLAHSARLSLPLGLAISGTLAILAWLLGPVVLGILNPEYGARSAGLLAILAPAGLWMVVKDHLVAWLRVDARFWLAAALALAATAVETGAAVVGGVWDGATGLALLWVLSGPVEALLAIRLVVGFLALVRREGAVRGPMVVLVGSAPDRLAGHLHQAHDALLLTVPDRGLLPVEALRTISELNPVQVVCLPGSGPTGAALLRAVLATGAGHCPVDLVVAGPPRGVPRLVVAVLRRRIRVVAGDGAVARLLSSCQGECRVSSPTS